MARYGVAEARDTLSALIDEALAGEEVVITRHGLPMVELRAVRAAKPDRAEWLKALEELRDKIGPIGLSSSELLRLENEEARF